MLPIRRFLPLSLSLIIFSTIGSAQTFFSPSKGVAIIRSDSTSRSALLTSFSDKPGDQSQLLATGMLYGGDSITECLSLLAFDYSQLPTRFKPENILEARLILFPLRLENEELTGNNSFNGEIVLKRVIENWDDSLATWKNKPATDEEDVIVKKIRSGIKEGIVDINVTKQVRQMMKEGNYGFLISSKMSSKDEKGDIQWFASVKHEDKILRPVLRIYYSYRTMFPTPAGETMTPRTPLSVMRDHKADEEYREATRQIPRPDVPIVTITNPFQ
jgi:hypothetical protein